MRTLSSFVHPLILILHEVMPDFLLWYNLQVALTSLLFFFYKYTPKHTLRTGHKNVVSKFQRLTLRIARRRPFTVFRSGPGWTSSQGWTAAMDLVSTGFEGEGALSYKNRTYLRVIYSIRRCFSHPRTYSTDPVVVNPSTSLSLLENTLHRQSLAKTTMCVVSLSADRRPIKLVVS